MNDAELIRLVDRLEDSAQTYVTLADVERTAQGAVSDAISRGLLLVDHRAAVDGSPVTVCRLNRRHPLVAKLTGW